MVRLVLFLDGLSFISAAVAMRALGPPPFYLPHNVAFSEAVLRAAVAQARSAAKPTMDAAETRALFELLKALSKAIEARLSPPRALAGDIARSPSF